MSADKIVDKMREPRTIPAVEQALMAGVNATVASVEGGVVTVTIEYFDGGIHFHGPILTRETLAVGDEILIAKDELDRWWLIGAK